MELPISIALLLSAALLSGCAWAADQASCPVPTGVRATTSMKDLPAAVRSAVEVHSPGISPPGGPFDATDVILQDPPHFDRVMFLWSRGDKWLVATQHGGIGYSEALLLYAVARDGASAVALAQRQIRRDRFCATAAELIQGKY